MLKGSNLPRSDKKYDIFEILSVQAIQNGINGGKRMQFDENQLENNFRVSNHQLSSKKLPSFNMTRHFFVIICQIYALFSVIFGQFYEEKHHYKSTRHFTTKYRKIIFFVSNKSYDIGHSCNNSYFTPTITSYAVEGVAIVFCHPVHLDVNKLKKPRIR